MLEYMTHFLALYCEMWNDAELYLIFDISRQQEEDKKGEQNLSVTLRVVEGACKGGELMRKHKKAMMRPRQKDRSVIFRVEYKKNSIRSSVHSYAY